MTTLPLSHRSSLICREIHTHSVTGQRTTFTAEYTAHELKSLLWLSTSDEALEVLCEQNAEDDLRAVADVAGGAGVDFELYTIDQVRSMFDKLPRDVQQTAKDAGWVIEGGAL